MTAINHIVLLRRRWSDLLLAAGKWSGGEEASAPCIYASEPSVMTKKHHHQQQQQRRRIDMMATSSTFFITLHNVISRHAARAVRTWQRKKTMQLVLFNYGSCGFLQSRVPRCIERLSRLLIERWGLCRNVDCRFTWFHVKKIWEISISIYRMSNAFST